MKAIVVYESMFGNTARIAEVIARCLETAGDVQLLSVLDADTQAASDADLLIVGGPTHMHGMSRAFTRRTGAAEAALEGAAGGPGVREWLDRLPRGETVLAAAFDTRADGHRLLVGAASEGIARQLRKRGYRLAVPPESFIVLDTAGPLKPGEIERADAWAHQIAQLVQALRASPIAAA